jgi:MerR family transcriptional regulator, light-induced transcriptional regulator
MDELLSTVDVGRLAGVGPTAVKRWADQGVLPCVKTAGGHRRFERVAVQRFLDSVNGPTSPSLVDALLHSDGLGIEARLLTERSRLGSWVAACEMLGGVLAEVGERWRAGRITILQEHVASERLARALARIADALPLPPRAPRCVLACAEGDRHSLGLSLIEVALRESGWATVWAGQDTPVADLARVARDRAAEMIAVSASAASTDPEGLRRQAEILGSACAAARVALGLGGSGSWPDAPAYGERFRSIGQFVGWARAVAAARSR